MLKVIDLESQLKSALGNIIPKAIEQCKLNEYPNESDLSKEKAKEFADTFDELVTEPLAKLIASAIDYYVKNATITGTLITAGSPATQMCVVAPAPTPMQAGKIPNTLGIL
jgi:hypothetical protein